MASRSRKRGKTFRKAVRKVSSKTLRKTFGNALRKIAPEHGDAIRILCRCIRRRAPRLSRRRRLRSLLIAMGR